MRNNKTLLAQVAGFVFALGIALGVTLSAGLTWAELEAVSYSAQTASDRLTTLECPLLLSEGEAGTVAATFSNPMPDAFDANVSLEVSQAGTPRRESTALTLLPGTRQRLSWALQPQDIIWGRLILVNVYYTPPAPVWTALPPRQGSCGILMVSRTGLSGLAVLRLSVAASCLSLALGALVWSYARRPLAALERAIGAASAFLLLVVLLTMLCAIERWWGLGLFGLAATLLTAGVIITEFFLFPALARERYAGS